MDPGIWGPSIWDGVQWLWVIRRMAVFALSWMSSVLPGLLPTCPLEQPLSQDSKVGKGVLQRFHPPAGWSYASLWSWWETMPLDPQWWLPPGWGWWWTDVWTSWSPTWVIGGWRWCWIWQHSFTQMELDDDGLLLERDVRDNSTHSKNVLVIVHSNGVHHLLVHWCRCPGHIPDDIQALNLQFFPASFKQVKTLFTFEGLDSFLAENQECKSSAWHYYQKLRRFTSACYPETIPVSNW